MDELDILYNYGFRGIDTQIERDIINYNPALSYIKREKIDQQQKLHENFMPSAELSYLVTYNLANTEKALTGAKAATTRLLAELKEKLKDIKVLIDEPFEEKALILKAYVLGSTVGDLIENPIESDVYITFDVFDRACRDTAPEARSVMYLYMEKADCVPALLYPDAVLLDMDMDINIDFVNGDCRNLATAYGYDSELDLEGSTKKRIEDRISLENRKTQLEASIQSGNTDPDMFLELSQIEGKLSEMDEDTTPLIGRVVEDRAVNTEESAKKLYGLTVQDITTALGGGGNIDGLVSAVLTVNAQDDPNANIREIRENITKIKKIVSVANSLSTMRSIKLTDLILTIISPVIKQITNQLISFFAEMKVNMIAPPLKWLDKLSESTKLIPYKVVDDSYTNDRGKVIKRKKYIPISQAVDRLANTIIDVANNIEDKFQDFILDYYKITKSRTDAVNEKLSNAEKKAWAEAIYRALDIIEIGLAAVQDQTFFNSLDNIQSYVDRVKEKLDWDDDNTGLLDASEVIAEESEQALEPVVDSLNWRQYGEISED